MTTVVVPATPPAPDRALPGLEGALSPEERVELATAMLKDVLRAVDESGGDLLLNYPPADRSPAQTEEGTAPEDRLRDIAETALGSVPRMEVQVGETPRARIGNAITHLLESEGVQSAAAVSSVAPLLDRTAIDTAAMRLRSAKMVLGPTPSGGVFYVGMREPVDFGSVEPPEFGGYARAGRAAGFGIDRIPTSPIVRTERDLAQVIAMLEGLRAMDHHVPPHTAGWIDRNGLTVSADGPGELTIVRA